MSRVYYNLGKNHRISKEIARRKVDNAGLTVTLEYPLSAISHDKFWNYVIRQLGSFIFLSMHILNLQQYSGQQ